MQNSELLPLVTRRKRLKPGTGARKKSVTFCRFDTKCDLVRQVINLLGSTQSGLHIIKEGVSEVIKVGQNEDASKGFFMMSRRLLHEEA